MAQFRRSHRFTKVLLRHPDDILGTHTVAFIDGSQLLPWIELWKRQDSAGPGGRPETFPVRALLVTMVLCALTNQSMLATRFTDVLFSQISPTMRDALGMPNLPLRVQTTMVGTTATATSGHGFTPSWT